MELSRLRFNQQQMSNMICETLNSRRRRHSQGISTPVSLVEESRVSLQEAFHQRHINTCEQWPHHYYYSLLLLSPSPDTKDKTDPHHGTLISSLFFGGPCLLYQGKKEDVVFRFIIIEYSSLRDFYRPLSKRSLFLYEDFWKMMLFWLVLKLEISYCRVLISWMILISFREFFEDYIFARWNIWVSIILLLH